MKTYIKKSVLALAALSFASSASAVNVTVGGVTWDPDNFLDLTMQNTVYENDVNAIGDILNYYGSVSAINGSNTFVAAGAELTFGGSATVTNVGDFDGDGDVEIVFGSATMDFYYDATADFVAGNGPATWAPTATNGSLWLQLDGHTTTRDLDGTVNGLGTLLSGDFFASLAAGLGFGDLGDAGAGNGSFDVIGGAAQAYINTNSVFSAGGQALNNPPADLSFTSEFQPILTDGEPSGYLAGNITLRGQSSVPVPEPSSMALLGLGLLGLGRWKSKSKGSDSIDLPK